jgi:myo-inositol-1(or 4)-monophosphatase
MSTFSATQVADDTAKRIHDTAIRAARRAGELLVRHFRKGWTIERKSEHDLTLDLDRWAEAATVEVIKERFSDHWILAEEGGYYGEGERFIWILDPLDGTVNYAHGLPHFCTSVCCHYLGDDGVFDLEKGLSGLGEPVSAVVYAPLLGEMHTARHGAGAKRNGSPVQIHLGSDLGDSLVSTTFGSSPDARASVSRVNVRLGEAVRKLRSFGATAMDLAYVASGHLGGLYHPGIRTWDVLAGRMLVEEAGGIVEALSLGGNRWEVIAGAPGLHVALRKTIRSAGADGLDALERQSN